MLTAPLFTDAVLGCFDLETNAGYTHCLIANH
jgi:hypothetical protein